MRRRVHSYLPGTRQSGWFGPAAAIGVAAYRDVGKVFWDLARRKGTIRIITAKTRRFCKTRDGFLSM